MKISKARLKEIIQEEVNEYGDGAGTVGSRGVAGSYGSTGLVNTYGVGDYDIQTHAESIASAYGKGEDQETQEKIADVLSCLLKDKEPDEASRMISDMLYHLIDKDDMEADPMAEGGKGKLSGKGIPYTKATGAGKYPDVKSQKGKKDAKRDIAKSRRRQGKKDVEDQMSEQEENNPWAICHTTVDKDKDPAKYERCVIKIKKKNKQ